MRMEVLVGMIASGKSSYAKKRAQEGAIVVNADSIVLGCHGGDYSLYTNDLKAFYKTIETQMILAALSLGKTVIVDRTNLDPQTRQRYLSIGRMMGCDSVVAVVFPIVHTAVHAIRRVESDPRGYTLNRWEEVAREHLAKYRPVVGSECFDEIITLTEEEIQLLC